MSEVDDEDKLQREFANKPSKSFGRKARCDVRGCQNFAKYEVTDKNLENKERGTKALVSLCCEGHVEKTFMASPTPPRGPWSVETITE